MLYIAKEDVQRIYGYDYEITAPNGYKIAKKKLLSFPKGYRLEKAEIALNMPPVKNGTILYDGNDVKKIMQSNLYCGDFLMLLERYSPIYAKALSIIEESSADSVRLKDLFSSFDEPLSLHLKRISHLLKQPEFGPNYVLEVYPDFGMFCIALQYIQMKVKEEIPFLEAKNKIVTGVENANVLKLALSCHPDQFKDA